MERLDVHRAPIAVTDQANVWNGRLGHIAPGPAGDSDNVIWWRDHLTGTLVPFPLPPLPPNRENPTCPPPHPPHSTRRSSTSSSPSTVLSPT